MSLRSRIRQYSKPILRKLLHGLDKISLRLYCYPHDWSLRLSTGPLYRLRRLLRSGYRQASIPGYRMTGTAAGQGHPLQALVYLEAVQAHYFRDLLFEPGSVTIEELGNLHTDRIHRTVQENGAPTDLVIFEDPGTTRWSPPGGEWIRLPATVRMILNIPRDMTWESFEPTLRYQKTNLKRVKKAGYQYRISHEETDFDLFFERMCIPTIQSRYGDRGKYLERDVLHKDFQRGGVLMVSNAEGEPVAGKVFFVRGKVYFDILYGVLDGRQDLLDQGALSAMYQYSIKYCISEGLHRYDGGVVVPLLDDGVYVHKKRWGFSPVMHPWGNTEMIVWAPGSAGAAFQCLREHRFIKELVEIHGPTLRAIYTGEKDVLEPDPHVAGIGSD